MVFTSITSIGCILVNNVHLDGLLVFNLHHLYSNYTLFVVFLLVVGQNIFISWRTSPIKFMFVGCFLTNKMYFLSYSWPNNLYFHGWWALFSENEAYFWAESLISHPESLFSSKIWALWAHLVWEFKPKTPKSRYLLV